MGTERQDVCTGRGRRGREICRPKKGVLEKGLFNALLFMRRYTYLN